MAATDAIAQIVPPAERLTFIELPTEIYYSAFISGKKVDQTNAKIFELNANCLELLIIPANFRREVVDLTFELKITPGRSL